jgi:hypothetical protein
VTAWSLRGSLLAIAIGASTASAQTAALPAPNAPDDAGYLTRAAWLLSVAPMKSADPRFAWSMRNRFDVDLARYPRGRVNLFFDNEVVLGRERREFDFNHGNIMFETSASARVGGVDLAFVFHHVSRHLIDREAGRVAAWHTVAGRVERPFTIGRTAIAAAGEYHWLVQHTFVDYRWTSQVTVRAEHPFENGVRLFGTASSGVIGVDRVVADRDRQIGARAEGGVHLVGRRAGLDLFAAYERRVDGYPLGRAPVTWIEGGFRLGSR